MTGGATSGNITMILWRSFWERSWMLRRVDLGGGTRSGGRMDRQRAVRKDVCWTLSVDTKQLANTGSYLSSVTANEMTVLCRKIDQI
jgi:hypothetical protein